MSFSIIMPLAQDAEGNDIWRFGAQNNYSTCHNLDTHRYQKWNRTLRAGSDAELIAAQNFVDNNDPLNEYRIDFASLMNHHNEVRWLYTLDTNLWHQPTSTTKPPFAKLDDYLWNIRHQALLARDNGTGWIVLPTNGGIQKRGQMISLIGSNAKEKAAKLPPAQYAPIAEAWDFFQQYLIPKVSSPYLRQTAANIFTLYFETSYPPINVSPTADMQFENPPRNWLYYGAPGTGKSHDLEQQARLLIELKGGNVNNDFFPYSFSPAITYGDFIGEYRPNTIHDPTKPIGYLDVAGVAINPPKPGSPVIDYAFFPGIFIKALIRAYTRTTPVVLLIDEINRGDIYEILGEVFQLMERQNDGSGSYSIPLNQEAMAYIRQQLQDMLGNLEQDELAELGRNYGTNELVHSDDDDGEDDDDDGEDDDDDGEDDDDDGEDDDDDGEDDDDDGEEGDNDDGEADDDEIPTIDNLMSRIIPNNKIRLPQNFYLWGTMNPNDTSVQQIDSAFMRRWVTRYIGIDHGADEDRSLTELPQPLEGEWGEFRKQLNNLLIRAGCDEEELIGMWFLKDEEFADWEKFYSKLVFHLANNVLKMRLSEDNGIFIMDSVREIMKLCETNQSPFNPEYFTGSNLDPEDDIQSALEDEFPEANQEEIADLMAQIKDDYPLKRVIQDRKEAIAAHEAQNNA